MMKVCPIYIPLMYISHSNRYKTPFLRDHKHTLFPVHNQRRSFVQILPLMLLPNPFLHPLSPNCPNNRQSFPRSTTHPPLLKTSLTGMTSPPMFAPIYIRWPSHITIVRVCLYLLTSSLYLTYIYSYQPPTPHQNPAVIIIHSFYPSHID